MEPTFDSDPEVQAVAEGLAATAADDVDTERAARLRSARTWTVVGLLMLFAFPIFVWRGWLGADRLNPTLIWVVLFAVVVVLLVGGGKAANGKRWGALIDGRNRVSLSRLQIVAWTVVIGSAWFAVFVVRVTDDGIVDAVHQYHSQSISTSSTDLAQGVEECRARFLTNNEGIEDIDALEESDPGAAADARVRAAESCEPDPLSIIFPEELLLVLGISTASLAGSKIVKTSKRRTSLSVKSDARRIGLLDAEAKELETSAVTAHEAAEQADHNLEVTRERVEALTSVVDELVAQGATQVPDVFPDHEQIQGMSVAEVEAVIEADQQTMETQSEPARDSAAVAEAETYDRLVLKKAELNNALLAKAEKDEAANGILHVNSSPDDASLGEMFLGDEVGNYDKVDISKVQMFVFTIGLVVAYIAVLLGLFADESRLLNVFGVVLPSFTTSMVTLLAISHAGYIGVKSVDATNTQ